MSVQALLRFWDFLNSADTGPIEELNLTAVLEVLGQMEGFINGKCNAWRRGATSVTYGDINVCFTMEEEQRFFIVPSHLIISGLDLLGLVILTSEALLATSWLQVAGHKMRSQTI